MSDPIGKKPAGKWDVFMPSVVQSEENDSPVPILKPRQGNEIGEGEIEMGASAYRQTTHFAGEEFHNVCTVGIRLGSSWK